MSNISRAHRPTDVIVDRRRFLVGLIIALTAFFAWFAPGMEPDRTLKSGVSTDTPEYAQYQRFLETFGNEEFVLIAVKNRLPASDQRVLQALSNLTRSLDRLDYVDEVLSLSSLDLFQERDGKFGSFPVVRNQHGRLSLPSEKEMEGLRQTLPIMDLLLSKDWTTLGFVVELSEQAKLNPPLIEKILDRLDAAVLENFPDRVDYRIVGAPVVIHSIQRYNVQTALTFGILCSLICTLISFYLFKSLKVTGITLVVVGAAVVWVIGFMALTGVQLNSTTGLSFGMILVVSVAAVVHIVTHYNERFKIVKDREEAVKQALAVVARPCLMCSLTTATGFASITVSSIPMVRQLGFIMALGVMASYMLAVVITPALLVKMNPPDTTMYKRMAGDWLAAAFGRLETFVFSHYRLCAALGLALVAFMIAGTPRVSSDTQILRMLTDRTKEIQDLKFVEKNLANVYSLEIVIEGPDGTFKKPESWKEIGKLEKQVMSIPEVDRTDSLLSTLQYLGGVVTGGSHGASRDLSANRELIPQLLAMMSFSSDGKAILHRYVNDRFSSARISVRIVNSPDVPVGKTLERVRQAVRDHEGAMGKGSVTGALAVFETQASDLVSAQTISLLLALSCITILMIIQFRSITLGLISLIPNVVPLTVIFGLMGWCGISLDTVTVFAATVSIGLSVDDTIHYLTQLQREIGRNQEARDISGCLAEAYRVTAKALMSTSTVLFFGFLVLLSSPFRPVTAFGILGSAAVFTALAADLIFMPSIILAFRPLRNVMNSLMGKLSAAQDACGATIEQSTQ